VKSRIHGFLSHKKQERFTGLVRRKR
jgi:hypothetical protein